MSPVPRRPYLAADHRRTRLLPQVRVTQREQAQIKQQARRAGKTVSAYIRDRLLSA